ncbi:hypothetical protein GCM10027258_52020 [Amycolatopsis stemonae]
MKKLFVVVTLAVLALAGGCGIKPTPAVGAGPAPTLRNPAGGGGGADLILYFVMDGRVRPVARPSDHSVGVSTALSVLLSGPTDAEAADGYTTMLPPEAGPIALSPGTPAAITFPFPIGRLSATAVDQLVCTSFAALAAVGSYVVGGTITLVGQDTTLPAQTCQAS